MDIISVNDYYELYEFISYDREIGESVSVVGYYEDINAILKELCCDDSTFIESIDLHTYQVDGYDKEYILSLNVDGGIWCEPLYVKNKYHEGYISAEDDNMYIFSDVNSKCLSGLISENLNEVVFIDDEEEDRCDCP